MMKAVYDPDHLYGRSYFAGHCGTPYARTDEWLRHFATVAEHIVADIAPATVLDVGCAMGFLVEALHDRGVEAEGIDVSEHALTEVRPDVREACRLGSVLEAQPRRYQLVVCIEVLEHLDARDAERAVASLCATAERDILFSSTPSDHAEATHVNVRPIEYWVELFARHGFYQDVDYDVGYIAPWATRLRRARDPVSRVVASYARELWRLRCEAQARNRLVLEQAAHLAALDESNAARVAASGRHDVAHLREEITDNREALDELKGRMAHLERQSASLRASVRDLRPSAPAGLGGRIRRRAISLLRRQTRR